MYISEIQKRIMNAIGVCGNQNGVLALAIANGANPQEMTDTYHLALWFEGSPSEVKHKLCALFDEGHIYEHGLRICSVCGKFFTEGYMLGGESYACSYYCALKNYINDAWDADNPDHKITREQAKEMLDFDLENYPDDNFWTEWYQEL